MASTEDDRARKRRARKQARQEQTRADILAAARRIILENGLGGTTLDLVAAEAGLSKASLYYYFASKDALLADLVFEIVRDRAQETQAAVAGQPNGPEAVRALVESTFDGYCGRMDDFRLAYLHAQVAGPSAPKAEAAQLERVRPLNDMAFAGAAEKLTQEGPNRAGVDPRLMAFLAQVSALGVLTMKGMVESLGDPLRYSDAQLVDALAAIFAAAAQPARD